MDKVLLVCVLEVSLPLWFPLLLLLSLLLVLLLLLLWLFNDKEAHGRTMVAGISRFDGVCVHFLFGSYRSEECGTSVEIHTLHILWYYILHPTYCDWIVYYR